jgi:hypothetical protein
VKALFESDSQHVTRDTALVELLLRQQERFGIVVSDRQRQQLADGAPLFLTGQQCGLFGGPALTLWKLLGMLALADRLEAAGRPRPLCLFWMESNDHDWKEAAAAGYPLSAQLKAPETGTASVGRILLSPDWWQEQAPLLEPLQAALDPSLREGIELQACSNLVQAFAKVLKAILPASDLLLLDPSDPEFRNISLPVYEAMQAHGHNLSQAIARDTSKLLTKGMKAPVAVDDRPLWFLEDGAGNRQRMQEWETNPDPEKLSPNALGRVLLQDALLKPAAVILGPTERAYHKQLLSAREVLGLCRPLELDRPRLQLARRRDVIQFEGAGLDPWNAPHPGDPWSIDFLERLPGGEACRRDMWSITQARDTMLNTINPYLTDPSAADLEKRAGRISELISQLAEQLLARHKATHRSSLKDLHAKGIWQDGSRGAQERRVNSLALLTRMGGLAIVDRLLKKMDPLGHDQQRFIVEENGELTAAGVTS